MLLAALAACAPEEPARVGGQVTLAPLADPANPVEHLRATSALPEEKPTAPTSGIPASFAACSATCAEGETCFAVVHIPDRKAMEDALSKLENTPGDDPDARYDAALEGSRVELGCKKEVNTACPPRTLSRHQSVRVDPSGQQRRLVCFVSSAH